MQTHHAAKLIRTPDLPRRPIILKCLRHACHSETIIQTAGIVNRHIGYAEHPQNFRPEPMPFLAVLSSSSLSHLGRNFRVSPKSSCVSKSNLAKAEIRFMLQPKGIFHPKMYIFWNEKHWEALIGSANLTSAALTNNSELMVLISDSDDTASQMKKHLLEVIDEYWINATAITEADAHSYRALWERHQPTLKRLANEYGKSNAQKPPTASLSCR